MPQDWERGLISHCFANEDKMDEVSAALEDGVLQQSTCFSWQTQTSVTEQNGTTRCLPRYISIAVRLCCSMVCVPDAVELGMRTSW